eukprot:CAMPEP_0176420476 /NCGR_PEP_ID=MMETSP0127-20121128/8628_1 /TAXON_ID=938130 /ORGANISM="Platyophrya macrostoma, Strain WH" /LENGTH=250 /DNA_ID=CAMNT_0017801077 /DNA_START=42 /DNA_END=794 /DNA_ORIENTATION=+
MASLIDAIFGVSGKEKQNFWKDTDVDVYVEKGFSEEEARNLTWLNGQYNRGKFVGAAIGFFFAYNGAGYFRILSKTFPRLRYSDAARYALAATCVYAGYTIGDHIYTSDFRGNWANSQWTNLVSNRSFLKARDGFIANFEVVNRKFTTDEIKKFRVKESNCFLDTPRKWNYNPHIHGEDQEAFEREVARLNANKVDEVTLQEVAQQNPGKIAKGETINHTPYHLNDHVDRSGEKQGTQFYPWFTGWKLQD